MIRVLMVLGALLAIPAGAFADATPMLEKAWKFDVYLGDKQIGYHRFEAEDLDDGMLVRSDADFQVKVLFITAFDYEHSNSEVWRDGCLQSIDARTNANGKKSEVLGSLRGDTFVVETPDKATEVDQCVATFAYWNRDLLKRSRLLNAQTGEYLEVEAKPLPARRMEIGGKTVPVEQLHLTAKGVDIIVSYAVESGTWVALDSTLKNGRTLSYRRSEPEVSGRGAIAATDYKDQAETSKR